MNNVLDALRAFHAGLLDKEQAIERFRQAGWSKEDTTALLDQPGGDTAAQFINYQQAARKRQKNALQKG
jgi:hypothetical protein